MKQLLLLISFTLFAASLFGAKKSTIAVLPFTISSGIEVKVSSPHGGNLHLTRTIIMREFSNQLNQFLVKSRKFTVLDRENIARVMDENKLTESEWAKPGQEQKVGKLLTADYLVNGTINRLEFKVIPQHIAITGETAPRIITSFKVQFSITAVATGKVVFADQVTEKLTSTMVRREIPAKERRDFTLGDYKELLFEKTVTKVGNAILAAVFPVKIAAVDGNEVTLNRGQGAGIRVGQSYQVYKVGQAVIDPDTHEVLGRSEKLVGTVLVTAVEPRFSKAKVIKTLEPMQRGWICRPVKKSIKQPRAEYPKVTPGW